MMRFLPACLIFLALAMTTPRDSGDLRAHYGEPILERFNIRPGITLTAEYGPDGKACVLDVEPRKDFFQESVAVETLSQETVTSVLDEIVPPITRGKLNMPLNSIGISGGCNAGLTFADYENIQIGISFGFCQKSHVVHSATVHFKRDACGHPPSPKESVKKGAP